MNVFKKQYVRTSTIMYAKISFSSTLSASSSICLSCVRQPMNNLGFDMNLIYAYKYQSQNITQIGIKQLRGTGNEVYSNGVDIYIKCSAWYSMSIESLCLDGESVTFDSVSILPEGVTEAQVLS